MVYLSKLLLGCRARACLSPVLRDDYDHLVSEPALLPEQLLMNMKVRGGVSLMSRKFQDGLEVVILYCSLAVTSGGLRQRGDSVHPRR